MFKTKGNDDNSFETAIRETILANKDHMVQQMYDAAVSSLRSTVSYRIEDQLKAIFDEFIQQEIKPEFMKLLRDQREAMLAGITEGIAGVGVEIGKKLQAKSAEAMGNSWTASEILKKMFGV